MLNRIFNSVTSILSEYKLHLETITVEGDLIERGIRGIIQADAVVARLSEEE